jgi:menaquinone-dependent protoporphyrinogen oxidase
METRVLVAYASKYGATAEIAGRIGYTLREAGLQADVESVDLVQSIKSYQALVLGSAVYAGQWRKEAVQFLEDFEVWMAKMPVWLFSSGPTGEGDPVQLMKGWDFPEAQRPIAERIHARDIAFFHGALDMKKLHFAERVLVRGIKAPLGDFRDWAAIEAWAAGIAEALQQEQPVS